MHASAESHRPEHAPQRSMGEHVYAQRYCTEESRAPVGFVDFVIDANGHGQYIARIQQGTKPFLSLIEAEAWLQSRLPAGLRLAKG